MEWRRSARARSDERRLNQQPRAVMAGDRQISHITGPAANIIGGTTFVITVVLGGMTLIDLF